MSSARRHLKKAHEGKDKGLALKASMQVFEHDRAAWNPEPERSLVHAMLDDEYALPSRQRSSSNATTTA